MKTFVRLLIVLLVLAIAAGVGYLAMWEIPAPTSPVEKVIPNDQIPK